MKNKTPLIFALLTLCLSGSACAADIHWIPLSSILKVEGEIVKGDQAELINAIQHYYIPPRLPSEIQITSPGGDVIEALKIAAFVKKSFVTVTPQDQCNSACFFIVAAAAKRKILTDIGVHRPSYDKSYFAGLDLLAAQQRYQQLNKDILDFLHGNRVPDSVIQKMMNTPSSELSYIKPSEFVSLMGDGSPAYLEWLDAKCGSLDPDEEDDFLIIDTADSYDSWVRIQKEFATGEDAKYDSKLLGKAKVASEALPSGYRKYLREKGNRIRDCKRKATAEEQSRIFNSLIPRSSAN